jgi:hypothetical protein
MVFGFLCFKVIGKKIRAMTVAHAESPLTEFLWQKRVLYIEEPVNRTKQG